MEGAMRSFAPLFLLLFSLLGGISALAETACQPDTCGLPASEIDAFSQPNVIQIAPDRATLNRWKFHRSYSDLPFHSSPNGPHVDYIGGGYLWVTVLEEQSGWSRIGAQSWVPTAVLSNRIRPSHFAGLQLPEPAQQPYPLAWLLYDLYPSPFPGGEKAADSPEHKRYSAVNLYASVQVDGLDWYQIGVEQWVHQHQIARVLPLQRPRDLQAKKWISVDLYEQVAIAYEGELPVFATLVSSGTEQWPTREGQFQVYARFTSTTMAGGGMMSYYYLQDVPYAMYFDQDIALHGAYWHDSFGFSSSHGCVNTSLTDAAWLYNWMQSEYDYVAGDLTGADVVVYSSSDGEKPEL